jgi:hypothetical protein
MMKFPAACGVCVVLLAGWAGSAGAGTCRVALMPFVGPNASEFEDIVITALPGDCLALPVKTRGGPRAYAGIASRMQAGAMVVGKVNKGSKWRLRLWVRRSGAGASTRKAAWSGRRLPDLLAAVQRGAPPAMRVMLKGVSGPAFPMPAAPPPQAAPSAPASSPAVATVAPEPVTAPAAPSALDARPEVAPRRRPSPRPSDSEDPPGLSAAAAPEVAAARQPTLEMSVGPRVFSRTFTYTDNLSGLPGYTLGSALAVAAEAELFPRGGSGSGPVDFGFAGEFESSVGAKTAGPDGTPRDTRMRSYRLGGRIRAPARNFLFTLGGDYGTHQFVIDVDTMVPNVRYTFLRPSLAMRVDTGGKLSLSVTAAYLHILSVGGLGDQSQFPRMTAVGAEVEAWLGYAIDETLEVRLGADLRHYAQAMHVSPGDPFIAGGALDEHFGGSLLLTYRLR